MYRRYRIPKNYVRPDGYVMTFAIGHPRATTRGYVFEHILVVESAMGKELRASAAVHHVNEIKSDNRNGNLVACDSNGYHHTLHARQRAFDACGHASWRLCTHCGQYDDLARLDPHSRQKDFGRFSHRACRSAYQAEAHLARKARTA